MSGWQSGDSPHLYARVVLSLSVLLLGLASRRWARWLGPRLGLAAMGEGSLALGLFLSLLIVSTALAGRLFGSLDAGLGGALLAALLSFLLSRRLRPEGLRPELALSARLATWTAVLAMVLLYALLVGRYQMHDEHAIFGHKSMVEELRRGVYPPYLPPFPGYEVRYHYGFDLLAGLLARGYGLSADAAIDLTMLGLCFFMAHAAAALAIDRGAVRSAPFAAVAIHLGAGLAAVMLAGVPGRHPRCLIQYHHPSCGVELFPTQILNVFQHPVSLAVPLFLVALMVSLRLFDAGGDPRRPRVALWTFVSLAAALSLGQMVYFVLLLLALASAAALAWLRARRADPEIRKAAAAALRRVLLAAASALILAVLMGGMFAPAPLVDAGLVGFRKMPGFPEKTGPLGILWHHLANLGVGFALLPLFIARAWRKQRPVEVVLTAFALGGVVAAHLFTYSRSWDIVKFPSASSFALSMLFVLVVDRALAGGALLARWLLRALRAGVVVTGALAAAFLLFPLRPEVRPYDLDDWHADPLLAKCIRFIQEHGYRSEEMVYAQSNIGRELAVFGGLSVAADDYDLQTQGVSVTRLAQQAAQAERIKRELDPAALKAMGVGWAVLSDEEEKNLGSTAQARLRAADGPLEEVARFEGEGRVRRVFRVRAR